MPIKICIICKKEFITKTNGIVCSDICRKKHEVNKQNKYYLKKNHNKLVGIGSGNHPNNKKYDKPRSYRHYRKNECEICGSKEKLLVHHLDRNHNNCTKENLQTLCKKCHQNLHTKRDKLGRYIKQAK